VTPTVTPEPTDTDMPEPTVTPKPTQQTVASDITLLAIMKASGNTSLKLSWTKVAKADGYDIFFRECSKGSYSMIASVKGSATRSYKITGLKKTRVCF